MERELVQIEKSLKDADLTSGLESLQRLLNKNKSNHINLQIILERLYSLGQFLIKQKSFRTIFPLFQILLKLCTILEDFSRLCDIKNSLSFCYRTSGQINLALKECLEALELAGEKKPLNIKLPALHLNACAIYREDVGDLTIAKTHAELAYFFAKENSASAGEKEKRTLAVACYNYANILEELRDKANALVWFKEGLKFCEEKWEDIYMEQVFREKVNLLSFVESAKKTKKRTSSQRPSAIKKYHFAKESRIFRPLTYKKEVKDRPNYYNLSPISNKTLPLHSVNLERLSHESDVKRKEIVTPASSAKGRIFTSETSRATQRPRLSLVQSVIKIQRWYRKLFGRVKVQLKCEYLIRTIKPFYGVKYFICVIKDMKDFTYCLVEAWPLVRRIFKPKTLKLTLHELGEFIQGDHPGKNEMIELFLKSKTFILTYVVEVVKNSITLCKIVELFSGSQEISGTVFDLSIIFHRRSLEIQAKSSKDILTCSIKLDPLHDPDSLKSKVDLITQNLSVSSGKLLFKLM